MSRPRQFLNPGIIALVLVIMIAFSLSITIDRDMTVLEDAYSQVFVVACPHEKTYGTGWWINPQGYAVTAYHVVQACSDTVGIRGPWRSNLTLVAYDPELDVAVLRAEDTPSWAKGLRLADKLALGDEAYVVGYPIQLYQEVGEDTVKMSEIPRVNRVTVAWINPEKKVFEFSPGTDAGNSGGPIIGIEQNGVVGIVIYARHGVVSEGYYGLRMDGLVQFLDRQGIEYRVAQGHPLALYTGLGAVALLAILLVKEKGVRVKW